MTSDGRRRRILLRAWHEFLRGRGFDAAASLTFFTALAILPAALLVVASATLVSDRDRAADALRSVFGIVLGGGEQAAVESALADLLAQGRSPGVAVLALALTLWTVSGYAAAFGRAVNSVYEVQEGRWYPVVRLRMLVVSLPLVALGAVLVGVLLITPTVARSLAPGAGGWLTVWDLGRWPLGIAALVGILALLFRFAPNVRFTRIRWLGIGTLLALGVGAVLTAALGLYLTLNGGYSRLYGRIGLLLAALIWAYALNLAVVIGAQVDAEIMRMRQLTLGEDAVDRIRIPVKDTVREQRLADHRADDTAAARRIRAESGG